MRTFVAGISGLTPILIHRFDEANELAQQTRAIHIKVEDPRDAAERLCYRNEHGEIYLPGSCIARMLREMGASHKQRSSNKSLKYIIPAAVLVLDDQLVLRDEEGKGIKDFEVDSRAVVIPKTKGRIMRHRAKVYNWNMEFSLEIDDNLIDPAVIHMLVTEAGTKNGLGDFRPEKGGPFGRFQLVRWSELAQQKPKVMPLVALAKKPERARTGT